MLPTYSTKFERSYALGATSCQSLYYLLGKDMFSKCLKVYIDAWKYKHPTPYDFMNTFNMASGQNLNWFWKSWYFDLGYMDIGITDFSNEVLTIRNEGGRPLAFAILYLYQDQSSDKEIISPAVWKNTDTFKTKVKATKPIKQIKVKLPVGFDAIRENDLWTAK